MLHLESESLFVLNPTAAAIWQALDGRTTLGEISQQIAERAGVEAAVVRPEADRLVADLAGQRLVEADAPPGAHTPLPHQVGDTPPGGRRATRLLTGPRIVRPGHPTPWQRSLRPLSASRAVGRPLAIDGPFDALGFRFALESPSGEVARTLGEALTPLRTQGDDPTNVQRYRVEPPNWPDGPRRRWGVYLDDIRVLSPTTTSELLSQLLGHVAAMAAALTSEVVLHAAAVVADGGAVLLPAASGEGKSTLVAGLTRAGYRYLTDEVVAIDPDSGAVRGLRRPIVLKAGVGTAADAGTTTPGPLVAARDGTAEPVAEGFFDAVTLVDPGSPGEPAPGEGAPGEVVAVVRHRFDAGVETTLRPDPPSQTLLALWASRWASGITALEALDVLVDLAGATQGFDLARSEVPGAVALLAEVVPPPEAAPEPSTEG